MYLNQMFLRKNGLDVEIFIDAIKHINDPICI